MGYRSLRDRKESPLCFKLICKVFYNDVCRSVRRAVGKLFYRIFEKQSKGCCLLRDQSAAPRSGDLTSCFPIRKPSFPCTFILSCSGRPAFLPWERTAGVCFCMMRWLSGNLNSGALTGFRGYFPHNATDFFGDIHRMIGIHLDNRVCNVEKCSGTSGYEDCGYPGLSYRDLRHVQEMG